MTKILFSMVLSRPSADEYGSRGIEENISVYGCGACKVIEIHRHSAEFSRTVYVVEIVVANDIPAACVVASYVETADIPGFEGNIVYFVVFKNIVVSLEPDSRMGCIMDLVVGQSVPDAVHVHGWPDTVHPVIMVQVVVVRIIMAGSQCFPVTAGNPYTAGGNLEYIAAGHTVLGAAGHRNRCGARIEHRAFGDEVVRSAADNDTPHS